MVKEQMQVGKREVQEGTTKVQKRIVEQPVEKSITLKDENVQVEQRPANRPVKDPDKAFKEQTIEMTETKEVPMVSKGRGRPVKWRSRKTCSSSGKRFGIPSGAPILISSRAGSNKPAEPIGHATSLISAKTINPPMRIRGSSMNRCDQRIAMATYWRTNRRDARLSGAASNLKRKPHGSRATTGHGINTAMPSGMGGSARDEGGDESVVAPNRSRGDNGRLAARV